jgi:hypothetical protein
MTDATEKLTTYNQTSKEHRSEANNVSRHFVVDNENSMSPNNIPRNTVSVSHPFAGP